MQLETQIQSLLNQARAEGYALALQHKAAKKPPAKLAAHQQLVAKYKQFLVFQNHSKHKKK